MREVQILDNSPRITPAEPPGTGGAAPLLETPDDAGQECTSSTAPQEILLGLYAMVDQSDSMAPLWDGVRSGITQFVTSAAGRNVFMGFQLFPLLHYDSAAGAVLTHCDPDAYGQPAAAIQRLPDFAHDIIAKLEIGGPDALRAQWSPDVVLDAPLHVALAGAIERAAWWPVATGVYGKSGVGAVVLITAGLDASQTAAGCPTFVDPAEEAARRGFEQHGIATYVIGVGDSTQQLQSIAEAGGTERVYAAFENGESKLFPALAEIRDRALTCRLKRPLGDARLVNVAYRTPDAEGTQRLKFVGGAEACELGGWYYDSLDEPKDIILCDTSCDVGYQFTVEVGCRTVTR